MVTRDVVYGHAVDHAGANDALRLDIYAPRHDAARGRAAIVWLHPGGFISGDKSLERGYATDFAKRGYVSIALDYRLRPTMPWFDMPERSDAARDAYEDATRAIQWFRRNAATYRIDTAKIFVAGYSAGAITALEVATPPDGSRSLVAGAMSIAGYAVDAARPGQPPRLVFHGTHDLLVPYALDQLLCAQARRVGDTCDFITFTKGEHDVGFTKVAQIADMTAKFFATVLGAQ